MAATTDDALRSLIRLIPPARALKDDLERSIHTETFMGTGDMAIRSFQGLQASVSQITNDPYVSTLSVGAPEGSTDVEKVSLVRLAAGQLLAYLEGQTGLAGPGGGSGGGGGNGNGNISIQKAPMITIKDIHGMPPEAVAKMMEMAEKALKSNAEDGGTSS